MLATIVVLIVFGIVLLGAEFILPGAVLGILGVAALIAATALAFFQYGPGPGFATAIGVVLIVIGFVAIWVKYFHRTIVGKKLTLGASVGGKELYEAQSTLVGQVGVAASDLRPSGKAIIDGKRVDVVAEVGLILKDEPVIVTKAEGIRIVVEKHAGASSPGSEKNA